MRVLTSMVAAALMAASSASAATILSPTAGITTYFDQPSYDLDVTAIDTESFDDATLNTTVFASSDPSTALGGSFRIRNDRLNQISGRGGASAQSTTFNLASGISAASFEFINFGPSESVQFSLSNGESFTLSGAPGGANGFFGFATTSDFASFTISDVTPSRFAALEFNVGETGGDLDAPVVPLPASLPLLLGALGLVGWTARRSRRDA